MKKQLLIVFVSMLFFGACQKNEIKTIPGNSPGEDLTINTQIKENYIQRLYILLLGRKADSAEFKSSLASLNVDPSSVEVRKNVVQNIIQDIAFYHKFWEDTRGDFLDGVDTSYIRKEYKDIYSLKQNASTQAAKDYYQSLLDDLTPLFTVAQDLYNETKTVQQLHQEVVNNSIYDDINMGTENYVISVFQNFLFRYPINSELEESKKIVDDKQGILFLQPGKGKSDFINIFFNNPSYYEGQVIYLHKKFLFRSPTSTELNSFTQKFLNNQDYISLQIEILASEEYFLN